MDESERSLNLGQVQANTQAHVAGIKKRRAEEKKTVVVRTHFLSKSHAFVRNEEEEKKLSLYNDRTVSDLFLIALNVT